ncbi:MAG TPA: hypothetical protein VIG74_01325 [Alphaproteobacteria bacterium]|jgi:hypothetical protein
MTIQTINAVFFAPVFFFIALFLYVLTAFSLLIALQANGSFLVVGAIAFVFGYNAWCFAMKLRKT